MVLWPAGNIGWWLLHGAVSTGAWVLGFTETTDTCTFSGKRENLVLNYVQCASLHPLFHLLQHFLLRFRLHLFLALVPLLTSHLWPHKIQRLPQQPPPSIKPVAIHQPRRKKLDRVGRSLQHWVLFLVLSQFTHMGRREDLLLSCAPQTMGIVWGSLLSVSHWIHVLTL